MRPLRFLFLLVLFVLVPVVLTCISLFRSEKPRPETWNVGYTQRSRFRALLSFSAPSTIFPPSAVITLTDDNSTVFSARPAAFGPSLPSQGLSGQLWIGKGFGEEMVLSEEALRASGFELGCSDVPGWQIDHKGRRENGAGDAKLVKVAEDFTDKPEIPTTSNPTKRDLPPLEDGVESSAGDDGTDDHLHYPLPDSNPASPEKPGEPASVNNHVKSNPPIHADIESLQESADIAGKVVMLSRGGCGFLEKVKWAQRRGGVAVIVGDNEPSAPLIVMYAKGDTSNVTIPAIFTSYYSAHMVSSLVPAGDETILGKDGNPVQIKEGRWRSRGKNGDSKEADGKKNNPTKPNKKVEDDSVSNDDNGWMQNVLSAVGLDDEDVTNREDSRRPPGSGNIDWVLLEDWDEDKPLTTNTITKSQKTLKTVPTANKNTKSKTASTKKVGNDDFIIGVQDWRDTELIAPKPTATDSSDKQKGKHETTTSQTSASLSGLHSATATPLKGGSITPGSGEYDHQKGGPEGKQKLNENERSPSSDKHIESQDRHSLVDKVTGFFHGGDVRVAVHRRPGGNSMSSQDEPTKDGPKKPTHKPNEHIGLWVTLTPTSPSASPFFDTLLVLVVSPLVTLTFVYGLLLLRSRIRRRRWRAPKSVVERLPVRTYHTMSSTSSTTSSSLSSPSPSIQTSPALRPAAQSRVRPRSQTTTGVLSSSPSTEEKNNPHPSPKRKRYTGKQIECVVCLEEYVDGESRVMSLPCGHEFHAECITPWLVTRRRTCPICKGDVVRSFGRARGDAAGPSEDAREEDEETSDDIQDRAAMTENSEGSAAIPIPVAEDISAADDIERGSSVDTPLLGSTPRAQHSGRWRGILGSSFGRLSGDTLWRSSVNDRSR